MDFSVFDTTEMDQYAAEAKTMWGITQPYQEFEQKNRRANQGTASFHRRCADGHFRRVWAQFATFPLRPRGAQALVAKLQNFITEHYYTRTKQILRGLGQMYITGDSMTENIERVGGKGTALFIHKAIQIYCT